MKKYARVTGLAALAVIAIVAMARPSKASIGTISKADLSGSWQMTMVGQTGCGMGTTLYTFTLNGAGVASNVTGTSHSAGCGDGTTTGNTLTIITLNGNGTGTAGLTCGTGCGFTLNIQVAPDRSVFNVVDVSTLDPGNYIQGVAVHQ
jgi:hypothetical protein